MRSAQAGWRLLAALATVTILTVAGCANDQDTVNRVQPNALQKSTLDGDWYYLQTVIDTPSSIGYTFVGDQGDIKKIRWEIQEQYLVARRTYEFVAGAEVEGPDAINDAKNTTMAMYKILSHFDIRREYNPATGEESNVVSENTTDRHWKEREYMRVDWSENLVTDGDFMMFARIFDDIETESASYYVQDGPDAPLFEKGADGKVNYVDIVNKMFVKPTEVELAGWGKLPSCFLSGPPQLCQAGEVSVRNSFRKVEDRDYQPIHYTGDRMQRFGYFVHERPGQSPDYGAVESERFRFAERHNLWMQSHRRDSEDKLIGCGTDSECGDVKGSKCDLAWGQVRRRVTDAGNYLGVCTMPYREREVRPIVYYMSPNMPADLQADAASIGGEWNKAFAETVASLRENECLAAKGENCAAERERDKQVFYLCTTPVKADAPDACGAEGFAPRPGDLRYSQLVWVSSEESGGPLGYGPGHSDPESGETLMGNAYIYGRAMERAVTQARDIVRLLNHDLTVEQIQSGDYIDSWLADARARDEGDSSHDAIPMNPAILEESVKAMDFSWVTPTGKTTKPKNLAQFLEQAKKSRAALYQNGAFGNGTDEGSARLARLKGTEIEAMMITPEMRMAAGLDPFGANLDEGTLDAASPLRGRSLESMRAMEAARQKVREKIGYYDAEFEDEGLVGFAQQIVEAAKKSNGSVDWYGKKYVVSDGKGKVDYAAVVDMIRHPVFHGLALHEIGHSVGLRHNFSGSYDALNYRPTYWTLRNDGKMAPRLWDPLSDAEIKGRIRQYQYSTVMDYGHNFIVSDADGLGHYDVAAIKMGYGDLVEVFDAVPEANKDQVVGAGLIASLGYPFMLDLQALEQNQIKAQNYTDWPAMVGGIANIQKRADVPYTSLVPYPVAGLMDPAVDAKGRPFVPYMFCSDEQGDLNPDCFRYDAGADPYESVKSVIDSYWYYYPFISFRRQRLGFDVGPTVDRIYNRYFEKIKRAHQIYALYRPIFTDIFGLAEDAPFWTDQKGMGSWSAASALGFDMLRQVITTPEPGGYGPGVAPDGSEVLVGGVTNPLLLRGTVSPLDGRFLETVWDFDAGYYWFDQLDRVGYFYDKFFALITLVDPTTYFVGRDTDADIRKYQLNYSTSFSPGMTALFRSILSEDWTSIAPRLNNGQLTYPSIAQMEAGNMPGTPVLPNVSFSIQLYASVFGMGYIPQTYDQTFIQSSRLWVEGGAEEVVVDPAVPTVKFTDPDADITYEAVSYPDADGVEQGVAASLLNYASAIFVRAAGEDGVIGTSPDDPAAADDDEASLALGRKFVDNIDLVRRLTWELGFGAQP
jgi:hypothetical protein